MFWQFTDCLCSLNNFAVSFGFLVNEANWILNCFHIYDLKHSTTTMKLWIVLLWHLIIFKYSFLSLYSSAVSVCFHSMNYCFLVYTYIPLFPSHTGKNILKVSLIFRGFSYCTLNVIPLHESLFHCVQTMLHKGWKQMHSHVFLIYFMLLHF